MEGHEGTINCLLVYRGDLYSASNDKTIKRWTLDGKPLQILNGHSTQVRSLTVWNDTLVSGSEREIIQWTGNYNVELNSLLQNLSLGGSQITECSLKQQDFKSKKLFCLH